MILGESDPRQSGCHSCLPVAVADIYLVHAVARDSPRPFSVIILFSPHKHCVRDVIAVTGELPVISWGSMGGGIWTQHTAAALLKYSVLRGEYCANTAFFFFDKCFWSTQVKAF